MNPLAVALFQAFNEVKEETGMSDEAFEQALLETFVSSPTFSWLSGNIWCDTDPTVRN